MIRLLLLDGDGIGAEIVGATRRVLEAADAAFSLGLAFETAAVGFGPLRDEGTTLPPSVVERARAADGIVLGPVSHNTYPPVAEGGLNPSGEFRKQLDLFANIRPARTRAFLAPPCGKSFDLVVVRENTEGFYADRNMVAGTGELLPDADTALAIRKVTRKASARIAETAFRLAMTRPARHVTAVHKANVLRLSDGLFLAETRSAAERQKAVRYDEVIIDAMTAQLVRDASRYDVIVTTNMFGDILSDLTAELSGSLGLGASLNAGERHAMAQAQHGSAPDIAGKGIANPASLIGSAAMLLDWIGERRQAPALTSAARAIESALDAALANPEARTPDLGGSGDTRRFTDAVLAGLVH